MNASKVEEDLLHHHLESIGDPLPLILGHHDHQEELPPAPEFCLPPMPEFDFFRDEEEDDSISHTSSDAEGAPPFTDGIVSSDKTNPRFQYINPEPHISSQFYTFNTESHSLMIRCILERRLPTPDEIKSATPLTVLTSWRSVWKDRNEDTAYLTAWKRIQDKLTVHVGEHGNEFLCFKNNSNNQFVSHVSQWQDIVMSFHGDGDLKHLGLKETLERIKQVWTVGAKLYGIPESYIRVCLAACPVCLDSNVSGGGSSKRRRFEYTESFEVPAKEVPNKLQRLAAKHKVVLCIRQKYIRYKPFMAEVKDYACHRAGEPASSSKKSRNLKREPYASKRCGCGFRIRAILPILNYNEKDKTFVYQEEGMAVFKLYAVHSGHEPDDNARIMQRVLGHKGGLIMDQQDMVYGMSDETENDSFAFMGENNGNLQCSVLQQVKELRNEVGLLEGKMTKIPLGLLDSVSQELFDLLNKVKSIGTATFESSKSPDLLSEKMRADDDVLVGENDLADWTNHQRIYGDGKDTDLIEDHDDDDDDDDDSFGRTLGDVASWDQIRAEKDHFNEKAINHEDLKPVGHDGNMEADNLSLVYPENPKWYESPCVLGPGTGCSDNGFGHGEIV